MSKIWKEILSVIEALLVPPLSAVPSEQRPLSDKEVYIVIRWLKGLSNFFYAGGEGMPIEDIQNPRFRELLALPLYYEMPTDDLSTSCSSNMRWCMHADNGARSDGVQPTPKRSACDWGAYRCRSIDHAEQVSPASAQPWYHQGAQERQATRSQERRQPGNDDAHSTNPTLARCTRIFDPANRNDEQDPTSECPAAGSSEATWCGQRQRCGSGFSPAPERIGLQQENTTAAASRVPRTLGCCSAPDCRMIRSTF